MVDQRSAVREVIERVTISRTMIEITLAGTDAHEGDGDAACDGSDRVIRLPWKPSSSTRKREIIQGDGDGGDSAIARPMRVKARLTLIDALRKSHRWLDALTTDPTQTVEAIAAREGRTERSIRMTLSLAFVAPDIIKAAIKGRLPRGFGMKRLVDLPMVWPDQWRALGLKTPV